mgnify:CR=1 FL=1
MKGGDRVLDKIQIMTGDFDETVNAMSDESVGKLFKAIFAFANDCEPENIKDNELVAPTYFNLRNHIMRLEEARQSKSHAGRNGGLKGGAPAGNHNASKIKQNKAEQSKTKQNNAPIPNPIPIPKEINTNVEEIVSYLNEKTGKRFQCKGETVKYINGRINDGYTVDDFKKVIDKKTRKWKNDPKMCEFLRPSTLFAPSHFDEYLNEPDTDPVVVRPTQFNTGLQRADYDMAELERRLVRN